jgi:hypothetical protein
MSNTTDSYQKTTSQACYTFKAWIFINILSTLHVAVVSEPWAKNKCNTSLKDKLISIRNAWIFVVKTYAYKT